MECANNHKKVLIDYQRVILKKRLLKEIEPFNINDLPLDPNGDLVFSDVYCFSKVIGAGSFGVVISVIERTHLEQYAIKIIAKNPSNYDQIMKASYEAEILSKLDHPNIVKFHRKYESKSHFFILMELIKAGSLKDFLYIHAKHNKPLSEDESRIIMKPIFEAIRYLHSKNILHRDIKTANILIKSFDHLENSTHLADIVLCTKINTDHDYTPNERSGTLSYIAPELLKEEKY